MILAKELRGFHVRFRDIARGGIRIVRSRDAENYDQNSDSIFDENYNLALTQQKKNKEIPEGGSKGTILLNLEYQDKEELAFQKYVDGLLDVILPHKDVKDYFGKEEILFLGPDEGTADLMSWASRRARERGYKFWQSFATGKHLSDGGIPHDVYGMTTNSVHEYVLGILRKLNLQEDKIIKVQTGGPDGDLGSNEILISKDRTSCVIDGSGILFDPDGLDRSELKELAHKRRMVEHFNKAKLGPKGFFIHINDKNTTLPDGTPVKELTKLGFTRNPLEHAIYKRSNQSGYTLVGVYVDDLTITGSSGVNIDAFKAEMMKGFNMSDLGLLSYYLGIQFDQK